MNWFRKSMIASVAVLCAVSLSSCSSSDGGGAAKNSVGTTSSTINSDGFPLTGDSTEDYNRAFDRLNRPDAVQLCSIMRGWGQLTVTRKDIDILIAELDNLDAKAKSSVFDEIVAAGRVIVEAAESSSDLQGTSTYGMLAGMGCTAIGITEAEAPPTAIDGGVLAQTASPE